MERPILMAGDDITASVLIGGKGVLRALRKLNTELVKHHYRAQLDGRELILVYKDHFFSNERLTAVYGSMSRPLLHDAVLFRKP